MSIDPLESPLHAGIAGVELPSDEFDFGEGIVLRRTYCHVFAPFMAAFAPAPLGGYHPAPWKAVSGGLSIDVVAELFVPVEFKPSEWFDRLNTVWWFAALTRLVGNPYVLVPVIASHSFSEIASMNGEPTFWTVEATRQRLFVEPQTRQLATESLDWIKENWRVGGHLMKQNEDFNVAFQAFDQSIADRSPSVALLTLWGALERLFSPAHQELTFRVSASIAAYL